jgi:phospho-N-acetylmuramoyl-pentapeptide-transferase
VNGEFFYTVSGLFALTFLLTVLISRRLIPVLRHKHAGQPILEIGPSWHLSKAGTPTLGGLAFILGAGGALLLFSYPLLHLWGSDLFSRLSAILGYAVFCGAIGFIDDYCKLTKQKNQGLTAPQKYVLQLLASGGFLILCVGVFEVKTSVGLPFTDATLELGVLYYPLALLFLTGLVNALNLTDGVDGLLSSTVAVVAVFFVLWGYGRNDGAVLCTGAVLLGGALGFLCFNAHPAKVFMGDTGSLFLGGAVAAVGLLCGEPLTVLLAGGVFVIEAASVVLQVVFFKLTRGKRLFRMAPLHHHFEKGGWSEWQVVAVFTLFSAICASLALIGG